MKIDRDLSRIRWTAIFVACVQYAGAAFEASRHEWLLAVFLAVIGATSIINAITQKSQQRTRDMIQAWREELLRSKP